MTQSWWWMFPNRKSWYFLHQWWPLQRGKCIFESLMQCYVQTSCRRLQFNQQKDCSPITSTRERDHFHFKSQPFSHQHWDSISSCQSLAAPAPCVFPLSLHINSHPLPVWLWLRSVIMTLFLFTQHIYPSLLSAICWLTSSAFYWLSLMGQLKRVLTGLWNAAALPFYSFVKLEHRHINQSIICKRTYRSMTPAHRVLKLKYNTCLCKFFQRHTFQYVHFLWIQDKHF